jgi:hypothetical protein
MPSASSAVTARRQDPGASGDPRTRERDGRVASAVPRMRARTVSERPRPAASITDKTVTARSSDRTANTRAVVHRRPRPGSRHGRESARWPELEPLPPVRRCSSFPRASRTRDTPLGATLARLGEPRGDARFARRARASEHGRRALPEVVQSGRARRYSRRARIVARRSSLRRPSCTAFSRQRQRRRRCSASSNSAASRVAGQAFVVEDGRSASRAVRARTVAARDWLLDDGDRRSVVVVGSRVRLRQP